MEQVYNHTQNKPSSHARGITNSELKNKAQTLSEEADKIVQDSGLSALREPAGDLKEKAGSSSGNEGLHHHAGQLANQPDGTPGLEGKATNVIDKFEEVQKAYDALSGKNEYKQALNNPKVTAVETTYNNLKLIYDQVLNLTKLKYYAGKLKEAAAQDPLQDLKDAAGTLEDNVKNLRDTGENAKTVRDKFNDVKSAFYALGTEKQPNVQNQFDALNTAYDHIGCITLLDLLIPNLINNS